MTRFYWVRHGPTHARVMVGWTDLAADLSDTARIERLSHYLPADAVIVSSDLSRAAATADAIAGGRPRLDHRADLREIHFGAWEARDFDAVEAEAPGELRAFWDRPGHTKPPGGESWDELSARVWAATDALAAAHRGGAVIVVAHLGPILAQVQRARGISAVDAFAQPIGPLSVTELVHDGGWHLGAVNHTP